MACNITGTLYLIDGTPAANRTIEFRAAKMGVYPAGNGGVITDIFTTTTDVSGAVNFDLMPGRYFVSAVSRGGVYPIGSDIILGGVATVFDQPSADIKDVLFDGVIPENPPAWYSGAIQARDDSEQFAEDAEAARDDALDAKGLAEAARDDAVIAEVATSGHAANALLAQSAAEAARDAATVNAQVYADTAAGLAATTVGDQFQVVGGDEIIRYRHDAGPVASEVARYPAAAAVDTVNARLDQPRGILDAITMGVNLNVSFIGAGNGTPADTVGSPSLEAAAGSFVTDGGFAVSASGTSGSAPAILLHDPEYIDAVGRVEINPSAGTSDANTFAIGAIAAYQDAENYAYWAYARATGAIQFRRVLSGALELRQSFATSLPLGATSWTIETRKEGGNIYAVKVTLPGGITAEAIRTDTSFTFPIGFGVVARVPNARVASVVVSSDVSSVERRVSLAEKRLDIGTIASASKTAFNESSFKTTVLGNTAFDVAVDLSETVLIDRFEGVDQTPVASGDTGDHEPDFVAQGLPSGYQVLGTMPFRLNENALAPKPPLAQAQYHGSGYAALLWPIGQTWLETVKGVEVSCDLSIGVALQGYIGCAFRVQGGVYYIRLSATAIDIIYRTDNFLETSSGSYPVINPIPHGLTFPNSVRLVVRAYEDGGFIAQVGDVVSAVGFFPNPKELASKTISAAGVFFDPRWPTQANARASNLKIGPIPAVGSSRWRALPPEPAPIIPKFTKQGVVFDIAQADTGRGMLNFSVVPMHKYADALGITPIDDYYAYYSTDHDLGDGGIFLATAPTPTGPWTRQGVAGQPGNILTDGAGRQAETPVVHYDPEGNRLLMIYHIYMVAGVTKQQSKVAESTDGINWTIIDYIYDFADTALAVSHAQHTGYMSWGRDPLGVVPGWVGWSRLMGGAPTSQCATARSMDGITWKLDFLPIHFPFLMGHIKDTNVIHNHGYATQPFAYQGQRLLPVAPFRSASIGNSKGYIAIVRLGDDMRNMSAQEAIPFPLTEPDELAGENVISGVMVEDDILYLYYQSNGGSIRLATADLTRDPHGNIRPFT